MVVALRQFYLSHGDESSFKEPTVELYLGPPEQLVTVEFQTEIDVATGSREKRVFVKIYFEARDSGLLAALPDELWKTLCCLATYIDENGNCYPAKTNQVGATVSR